MITESEVSDYLDTQSDFDLELFVYRNLLNSGIETEHGGTYTDSVTGLARQFDIRGHTLFQPCCAISFAIECKSLSGDRPLVISRVPRPDKDSTFDVLCSAGDWKASISDTFPLRSDGVAGLYSPQKMVGKKPEQILKDGNKPVVKMGDS